MAGMQVIATAGHTGHGKSALVQALTGMAPRRPDEDYPRGPPAGLPQPFTAAEARQALQTTRRVAIPLLEFLDRAGVTQRLSDDRRRVVSPPAE